MRPVTPSDYYEFVSLCAVPTCRGFTTGRDWQGLDLQTKHAGWFSPLLARRIAAVTTG